MLADAMIFRVEEFALVPLDKAPAEALVDYQRRNIDRFAPYSPKRTGAFFTNTHWRRVKRRTARERREGSAFRWVILNGDSVIGQINLDQVQRGAFQSAMLGYSLDRDFEGRGLMTACLKLVIRFAFNELILHRICANHVPENLRSAAVLGRLGFEKEGYAKAYLRLDGEWKDHVLNALVNPLHH